MIFNPLFISENGTSQMLVTKPGKLSTNKYLFSDIVKVVMNPAKEQKQKLSSDINNIPDNKIKVAIDGDQNPIKLKFKFLSDNDNEQAKLELADILPNDIAQLLINEESIPNNDKAISYISKEPLKGELQNFLHGLIGTEFIEKNISNKSGLLLSMEDNKSAVNLELVKGFGSKSANDKIMVQTLVVPEKSKLLSLFQDGQKNNALFRIHNSSFNQTTENKIEGLLKNSEIESSKPTLSVYSFKYGGDEFESLTKSIKNNSSNKHNLKLLNNNLNKLNVETQKVPVDKISFIPSELKKQKLDANQSMHGIKKEMKSSLGDLRLFMQNSEKTEKDYSVSKITIVKKKGETQVSANPISKNKVQGKDIESALKRIDFEKKINIQNSKPNQTSKNTILSDVIKSKGTKQNSNEKLNVEQKNNLKIINNNDIPKVENNIKITKSDKHNTTFGLAKNVNHENNKSDMSGKADLNIISNLKSIKANSNIDVNEKSSVKLDQIQSSGSSNSKISKNIAQNVETKMGNGKINKSEELLSEKIKNVKESIPNGETKIIKTDSLSIETNNVKAKLEQGTNKNENLEGPIIESKEHQKNEYSKGSGVKIDESSTNNEKGIKAKANNSPGSVSPKRYEAKSDVEFRADKNSEPTEKPNLELKNSNVAKVSNLNNEEIEVNKVTKEVPKNDITTKGELKNPNSSETIETKALNATVINLKEVETQHVKINKKVSVKVKGGVKTVSDKNESNGSVVEEYANKEDSANNSKNSTENSSTNAFKNTTFPSNQYEIKSNNDNIFQQVLNKENISALEGSKENIQEIDIKSSQRLIKSVEVIKEISRFISKQDKGSLSFDISPEHLGKMKITLNTTDHVLKAHIQVDNEQSKQLIEKNLDKLHQELSENGVELSSLNISLGYSKQKKDEKETITKDQKQSENLGQVGETEEEKEHKSLGYNTYEFIA